jgi:hypothetical protein
VSANSLSVLGLRNHRSMRDVTIVCENPGQRFPAATYTPEKSRSEVQGVFDGTSSLNDMTKAPRVFVSSVMRDFEAFRSAARQGIFDAGIKPILIEDFPSMDMSSRTVCLDLVRSCDVYLVVIGDRPGASPLGKPVVEEEFEEARRRKLPRLMFLQNVARDADTEALADRLGTMCREDFE